MCLVIPRRVLEVCYRGATVAFLNVAAAPDGERHAIADMNLVVVSVFDSALLHVLRAQLFELAIIARDDEDGAHEMMLVEMEMGPERAVGCTSRTIRTASRMDGSRCTRRVRLSHGLNGHSSLRGIFHDAFACLDPQRLDGFQRSLVLAAQGGGQVIGLMRSPRDYDGFGGHQVSLAARSLAHGFEHTTQAPERGRDAADSNVPPRMERLPSIGAPDEATQACLSKLEVIGGRRGNMVHCDASGWAPPKFELVKQHSRDNGEIVHGPGRGGSVALASLEMRRPPTLAAMKRCKP